MPKPSPKTSNEVSRWPKWYYARSSAKNSKNYCL